MYKFLFIFQLLIISPAFGYSGKSIIGDYCQLPRGCKSTSQIGSMIVEWIICNDFLSTIDLDKCNGTTKIPGGKKKYRTHLVLVEDINRNYILNNDFNLHKIIDILNSDIASQIKFVHLKGVQSDLTLELNKKNVIVDFYDSIFDIYNQDRKVIKTCQDYQNSVGNISKNFIFSSSTHFFKASFINTQFRTPVCSLIFQYAKISTLKISYLVKSYSKTNAIEFMNENTNSSFNSDIFGYELDNFYGLDLDSKLINVEIFKKTRYFLFDGVINSIHGDVFKEFDKLKYIKFNPIYFLDFVRQHGIDWIRCLNSEIKVNFSDSWSILKYIDKSFEINFKTRNVLDFSNNEKAQFFYNEDFCLIKDFPFEQLIFINVNLFPKLPIEKMKFSCSTLWLIQYYPIYSNYSKSIAADINQTLEAVKKENGFNKCDFETRLKNCDRANFKIKVQSKNTNFTSFDFMLISQFLLVIFTPIVCLFGIATNMLIIITVFDKKNRKELKEKQYTYMTINSITNILIFIIQILSLMNECQYPFGIFCSSIRKYSVIQYYKIVFGETVSSFLRLLSNFTYLAFSINRLSLVGKNGDFVEFFSKLSTYKYLIFSAILSGSISLVKGFRFRLNSFEPDQSYPLIFHKDVLTYVGSYKIIFSLLFVFDAVYNFITYIIFPFIHILFDILLFYKIRKTIKEKEVKYKTIYLLIDSQYSKKIKENKDTIRRVLIMVILNALVSFICKLPISITSLNDLRILISTPNKNLDYDFSSDRKLFKFPYLMNTICYFDEICLIFENFGNFLFLISLVINIVFFYKFDKKFRLACKIAFGFNALRESK